MTQNHAESMNKILPAKAKFAREGIFLHSNYLPDKFY